MPRTVQIRSEDETLTADLYGELPARRAVVLVHGQNWDADGWREMAPRFVALGVPVLAPNLRGHGGSSGPRAEVLSRVDREWRLVERASSEQWSPRTDVLAAKELLRDMGATEIALVGASLGGQAVIEASSGIECQCVVSISAPLTATSAQLVVAITARKLFVCASRDRVVPHVLRAFEDARDPKTLLLFGGQEHSLGMFRAAYGAAASDAIVDFVTRGL